MYTPRGTLDRDSVIERYGKMVRRVAVQMAARLPSSIELDDLIQAGLIGLVDAVSRFDAAMGVQFDTFAMQRVRGAMLDELRNADWMPRSVRKSQRSIEQAIHAVEQRLGRPAQEREIADELQVPLEEYQRLLSSFHGRCPGTDEHNALKTILIDVSLNTVDSTVLICPIPFEGKGHYATIGDKKYSVYLDSQASVVYFFDASSEYEANVGLVTTRPVIT